MASRSRCALAVVAAAAAVVGLLVVASLAAAQLTVTVYSSVNCSGGSTTTVLSTARCVIQSFSGMSTRSTVVCNASHALYQTYAESDAECTATPAVAVFALSRCLNAGFGVATASFLYKCAAVTASTSAVLASLASIAVMTLFV
jgi:hypothetical protein